MQAPINQNETPQSEPKRMTSLRNPSTCRKYLLGQIAALFMQTGCGEPKPPPAFTQSFLDHVASNSPPGKATCYVKAVQQRWPSQESVRQAADKIRMSRGQTDVVNFAIRELKDVCGPHESK